MMLPSLNVDFQCRHDQSLESMNTELSIISNNVEPKITSIGDILQQQLQSDDEEINAKFKFVYISIYIELVYMPLALETVFTGKSKM